MLDSTGATPRWVWLTMCAILLILALALGYQLRNALTRLSTVHGELAIAREHATQTKAHIAELKNIITNLNSELGEAKQFQDKLNEANAQISQLSETLKTAEAELEQKQKRVEALQSELENAKDATDQAKQAELWKRLSDRTVALEKATAYRHRLERDLVKAKSQIRKLNSELKAAKADLAD
jgi:chromosome segregation ATPase